MPQLWTIWNPTTKEILCPSFETPSTGSHPKDNGWGWDATTQAAVRIDNRPDPAVHIFNGTIWIDSLPAIKKIYVGRVKIDNSNLVSGLYTTAFGKQKKYSRKQQEVLDWRSLTSSILVIANPLTANLSAFLPIFNSMTVTQQKKKFRFAMSQAAKRSQRLGRTVTVDEIINEFEAGILNEDQIADWEAIEQETCVAINAATTAAQIKTIYATIDWTWRSVTT